MRPYPNTHINTTFKNKYTQRPILGSKYTLTFVLGNTGTLHTPGAVLHTRESVPLFPTTLSRPLPHDRNIEAIRLFSSKWASIFLYLPSKERLGELGEGMGGNTVSYALLETTQPLHTWTSGKANTCTRRGPSPCPSPRSYRQLMVLQEGSLTSVI